MTREEAIKELEQRLSTLKFIGGSYVDCVNGEAIEKAIEALKQSERAGVWIRSNNPCYSPFGDSSPYISMQ